MSMTSQSDAAAAATAKFNISGFNNDDDDMTMNDFNLNSNKSEPINNNNNTSLAKVPIVNVINETKTDDDDLTSITNNHETFLNHGYDSTYSIRDVNSTANLLEIDLNNKRAHFDNNNHKTNRLDDSINNNSNVPIHHHHHSNGPNSNYNNNNNFLRPIEKSDLNNSSQSSIDTGIKFGDETDMIPLMPMNNGQVPIVSRENTISKEDSNERWYIILVQVIIPFLIAGFGMVGAGVLLDIVQHWDLYTNVKAIFTLIPALLGLKGNLEMTLASRFSTQVNLGKIKDKATILSAVLGNFALTQAQAIIVGFLASVGALLLKFLTESSEVDLRNGLVLIAGCMSTASFASLILAGLMMFIIIISKRLNINPDNIATPIAASLGDLVTLAILSLLCTFLYNIKQDLIWIHVTIIITFFILIPIFIYYSYRNDFVKDALYNGWIPILSAMAISSTGGFIMGFALDAYPDIAVFQPVVNGVGGNLVAIFASRLSTALHRTSIQGSVPSWAPKTWYSYPFHTFLGDMNPESKTALILAFISLPGHLIFYFTITRIKLMQKNHLNIATLTPSFVTFYTSISVLQVLMLLLICYWLVHLAWRKNQNPDNVCIPYLTAIGDLLGTVFLAICFHGLYLAGETRLRPSSRSP